MYNYKIKAYVDGRVIETIIRAQSQTDAKALFTAQYPMSKVTISWCERI